MCNGSVSTGPAIPLTVSAPPRVLPKYDTEAHLALTANFAACGRFRPQNVTADPRAVTCRACQLELVPEAA